MVRRLSLLLPALLVAMALPVNADNCTLRVAVAASFRPALEQVLPEFGRRHACPVQLSSGSSGVLYQQIAHRAPFDLFLSADRERPELLEKQGGVLGNSRQTYALGLLALWHPKSESNIEQLMQTWPDTIVLADPRVAPFGNAARQVLEGLGLWEKKQTQLARAHNAGQAYLMLDSGNAQLGFVAASQMRAAGRTNFWLLPQHWYHPIEQQLVIPIQSRRPQKAQALADYLRSPEVQAQLRRLGYGVLPAADRGREGGRGL
ncbi:molybdate ABC transporter substrate-binding protein [Microbulbifer spongiae]|uniref:Molybdate ABC transporter substrate-binding protein n=1 Tax=Microbulbifer spongiae TaxID=2944933 RepID=A0ABY9EDK6_9GAMM|nr:molybdate ABC transporter substrate-binding protein [Microbulbifer sp. MI-G]WKD50086.1 molybdate ABC transporter substrate-binding protein [Microbulbifer sp. MI-G]